MLTLLNLFGRSPFAPLKFHMEKVSECVYTLPTLFESLLKGEFDKVEQLVGQISKAERLADTTKNDIREHLPRSLFLPIDRTQLLDILKLQDDIADQAESIAIFTTLKSLQLPSSLQDPFNSYLSKIVDAYEGAYSIIKELHDLLESSFVGVGIEADKIRKIGDEMAYKKHEVNLKSRELLKSLFALEDHLSHSSFYLWMRIFDELAHLAALSEKVVLRVRMTLEVKLS